MKIIKKAFLIGILAFSSYSIMAQNSLDFDGSNDYVMMTSAGPSGTSNRTVEAWIKTSANQQQQQVLVDWGTMTQGTRFTFNLIAFGKLRIEIGGNGFNSTATVADGNWHHVAVTYDNNATNKAQLYIDGIADASGNFTVTMNTNNTGPIILGRRNDGINYFDGQMDEVRIWNTAKTAIEIQSGMNNTACGNTNGLLAYYNFNHGSAGGNNSGITTLTDFTGGNNGTLNNFALSGNSSNWVTGKTLTSATSDSVAVVDSLCDGYKYFMGPFTYTQPGIYIDTLSNSSGCDSIVHLTLHGQSTDATTSYAGQSFVANNTNPGVTYQWVNCSTWGILVGETNATFWPSNNSEYAVFVTENNCMDTSECMSLLYAAVDESPWIGLKIYPNPTVNQLRITFEESPGDLAMEITDINGRVLKTTTLKGMKHIVDVSNLKKGMYVIRLHNEELVFSYKFFKD